MNTGYLESHYRSWHGIQLLLHILIMLWGVQPYTQFPWASPGLKITFVILGFSTLFYTISYVKVNKNTLTCVIDNQRTKNVSASKGTQTVYFKIFKNMKEFNWFEKFTRRKE